MVWQPRRAIATVKLRQVRVKALMSQKHSTKSDFNGVYEGSLIV
jgi:hypothetical protein